MAKGRAFGLDLEVAFECPGLPPSSPIGDDRDRDAPRVTLQLASAAECVADLPRDAERLSERRVDGAVVSRFGAHASAGYLLEAEGYGTFLISADATRVTWMPVPDAPWRWQRYLVGQVLPFVAVLHGLEVFHASVVALGSVAVAFVGRSGAGKSSVAAALALRGAPVVADDVMAIRDADGPPSVAPGFGLLSLRHSAVGLLGPDATARLGRRVGSDHDGVRIAVDVDPSPRPVAALFFLERRPSVGKQGVVEVVDPVDPSLLLGSTYNLVIRTAERLTRHLDTCARLAEAAAVHRLAVAPGVGPVDLAAAVEARMMASAVRE